MNVTSENFVHYVSPPAELLEKLQRIVALFPQCLRRSSPSNAIALIEALGREHLPAFDPCVDALRRITAPDAPGALVLVSGGLFLDGLATTPREPPKRSDFALTDLDIVRVALLGAAGKQSYAYSAQADGLLCDDVVPLASETNTVGLSYGLSVGWHTEDAPFARDHLNTAFDTFTIAYLRNPNGDPTRLTKPILEQLSPHSRDTLRMPLFSVLTSLAHQGDKNGVGAPMSIVYEHAGAPRIRFTFARLDEQRDYYQQCGLWPVITEFQELLDRCSVEADSTPGNVLFLDNTRVAHSRAAYRLLPKYDGTDRWQKRLGASDSLTFGAFANLAERLEPRILESVRVTEAMRGASS